MDQVSDQELQTAMNAMDNVSNLPDKDRDQLYTNVFMMMTRELHALQDKVEPKREHKKFVLIFEHIGIPADRIDNIVCIQADEEDFEFQIEFYESKDGEGETTCIRSPEFSTQVECYDHLRLMVNGIFDYHERVKILSEK